MTARLTIRFAPISVAPESTAVVLAGADMALGSHAREWNERTGGLLIRAAGAAEFKGTKRSAIELLALAKLDLRRLIVLGLGDAAELTQEDWINLGGVVYSLITQRKSKTASLIAQGPGKNGAGGVAEMAADLAFGALLRSYDFTKYRTKGHGGSAARADEAKPADDDAAKSNGQRPEDRLTTLVIHCENHDAAQLAFEYRGAVAEGVCLARDLVNEPANALGPVEFAARASELADAGVEVEILDVDQLTELKMGALLAVGQGSVRPSRVAVMQWSGAKRGKPVCFVGKGVVFDSGGISMKPAAGMEDMKGDMGGAACVTGLMLTLARRKAKVNVVGLIGLVENMPSGNATRPGDIVTSMSGQTIEVLNTDAEGRMVLADVLWYAQERFKPRLIVDLATLTGAIMVALGKEHAGLFSNDDKLAGQLSKAGEQVGEKVWRMPLSKAYDKMIDSKNADMKNIGGRYAGSITAAQFLQRFIHKGTPWAHLDVAGTAMDSARNDINQSWGSGWGVRLLDRMVADHYES